MRPVSSKQKVWNAALAAGSVSSAAALIAPLLAHALMSRAGIDWRRVSDGDRLDVLVGLLVGIPGLVVGLLGAYLAWLAIRMGRENEKVTASQVEILGRLAGLEEKQAAMLERQHEVFERELKRRAVLKLLLPRPRTASGDGPTRYELFLTNDGDKVGTGFWYLGVPKRMRGRVSCEPSRGNEEILVAGDNWDIIGGFDQPLVSGFTDDFYLMKFRVTVPVEPGVLVP